MSKEAGNETIKLALGVSRRSLFTRVAVPGYGRAELSPGILHFGVGNFHRAHQAYYLDVHFSTKGAITTGRSSAPASCRSM